MGSRQEHSRLGGGVQFLFPKQRELFLRVVASSQVLESYCVFRCGCAHVLLYTRA